MRRWCQFPSRKQLELNRVLLVKRLTDVFNSCPEAVVSVLLKCCQIVHAEPSAENFSKGFAIDGGRLEKLPLYDDDPLRVIVDYNGVDLFIVCAIGDRLLR